MSEPKETWYFFDHRKYKNPINWYANHFFGHCSDQELAGEATPLYMAHPESPRRIFERLGAEDLQFFFLLRDPVERAVSHYHFEIQRGVRDPSRSFSEVIRDPVERKANPAENHVGLLEIGCYIQHLKRYEKYFNPDQIHPILFNDYIKNRDEVLENIFRALELGRVSFDEIERSGKQNPTKYPVNFALFKFLKGVWGTLKHSLGPAAGWISPVRKVIRRKIISESRKPPQLSNDDGSYLSDFYSGYNARLSDYLDRDLSHWE